MFEKITCVLVLPSFSLKPSRCIDSACAGPLEDGIAAYQSGSFPAAFELLRPLALEGDVKARFFSWGHV